MLREPRHAIRYIAAIMSAASDVASGFPRDAPPEARYHIRCAPAILTWVFQTTNLDDWERLLAKKKPGDKLDPGADPKTSMGKWVKDNLATLEKWIGSPDPGICVPSDRPQPAGAMPHMEKRPL
jgi:hypothetical protein